MTTTKKTRRWPVLLVTGVVLLALGGIFLALGLQDADRLASTIGALAGVAGLGLAIWSATATARSSDAKQVNGKSRRTSVLMLGRGTKVYGHHINIGDKAIEEADTKRRSKTGRSS